MAKARGNHGRKGPTERKGPSDSPGDPSGSKRRSGSAPAGGDSAEDLRRRQREEIERDIGDARSASPDEREFEPEA